MSFLKKFIDFCTKAKGKIVAFKTKAYRFIEVNRKEIKALMKFLQFMYDRGNGEKKMNAIVDIVCDAIGAREYKEDIVEYVKKECQKVYEELLADGEIEK